MCSCYSTLDCCNLFSGVELSIRSFYFIIAIYGISVAFGVCNLVKQIWKDSFIELGHIFPAFLCPSDL